MSSIGCVIWMKIFIFPSLCWWWCQLSSNRFKIPGQYVEQNFDVYWHLVGFAAPHSSHICGCFWPVSGDGSCVCIQKMLSKRSTLDLIELPGSSIYISRQSFILYNNNYRCWCTYQKGSCIDVAGHQIYNTQQQQRMEKLVRLRWMHRQLRRRSFCIPSAYPVDVVYIINDKNVSIKVKYIFIRIQRYLLNNLLIIYFNTISFYRLLNYVFVFRLLIIKLLFELLYKLHDRNLIECYMTANKYTTVVNLSCVNSSNI